MLRSFPFIVVLLMVLFCGVKVAQSIAEATHERLALAGLGAQVAGPSHLSGHGQQASAQVGKR